jgi:hypothetical protein
MRRARLFHCLPDSGIVTIACTAPIAGPPRRIPTRCRTTTSDPNASSASPEMLPPVDYGASHAAIENRGAFTRWQHWVIDQINVMFTK